jgi:long-subunit fatty acid transport protein
MRALALWPLPVVLLGLAPAAGASWIVDVETGGVYEDNLSFASMDRDIKDDAALTLSGAAGRAWYLTDRDLVSVAGTLFGDLHEQYSGLDHVAVGATAAYRRKLGLGLTVPWARVSASGARLQYRDDVRDGFAYRVTAGIGKRFGERWDLRVEYAFDGRTADHERAVTPRLPADVFDQQAHTVSAQAEFQPTATLVVWGGYAVRWGDVASTTQRNPEIFAASSAVVADPAFGSNTFAYKIDATTHILSAGLSFALGARWSVNVGYEHQIGLGDGGIDYQNNVVRGTLLYSY